MGQKVNPISNRLGYIRGWNANWFGSKKQLPGHLLEDHRIRQHIRSQVARDVLGLIFIERTLKATIITLHTSRPGMVIGSGGERIQALTSSLQAKFKKPIQVNVYEVKRPELDATLVAEGLASALVARAHPKRLVANAISSAMRAGAKGAKIVVSGRIRGADIARSETQKEGRMPLHTFRADIDHAMAVAHTIYGSTGVKVSIFLKEVFGKRDISLNVEAVAAAQKTRKPGPGFPRKPKKY